MVSSCNSCITGRDFATRSEVIARHGMAATSQPLATQIALDILKRVVIAVDASIAANAALGLMEPTGNGIGCDGQAQGARCVDSAGDRALHGFQTATPLDCHSILGIALVPIAP